MASIERRASARQAAPGRNPVSTILALCALLVAALSTTASSSVTPAAPPGLRALLANAPADQPLLAVAMLGHVPTAADVSALQGLGLVVQPMLHLPMAFTKGTPVQLQRAVQGGQARDFYRDQRLQWHSAESTKAMSADQTRALGYDGKDVGIAIVDSGIDATHPILKNRVVHNVRVYSPEYLGISGISEPTGIVWPHQPSLVLPFDVLPYNNTDTIGHGTHVSGIAAGDGTGNPELIGVAPGAHLVGYSTGEILFIFTALASFDNILAIKDEYNIRVVNNSWGGSYEVFDPNAPIEVASKALHDAGITVVFSAGNSYDEMSVSPHATAPWVINAGSATVSKEKSDFSSQGLMFDNSDSVPLDADLHVHFEGDGLGLTHPDVSSPGSNIVSSGTPTGVTVTPGTPPGGSATASGTSMAAPHITGLAAVLLQARPALTPDQVRQVMQVTAVPMRDGAAFWRSGYGFVDAKAALDLVLRPDFSPTLLDQLQDEADARVLAARPYKVLRSDQWKFVELGATAFGLESHDFPIDVGADTQAIRATVSFPADLGVASVNLLFEWLLELRDPDGKVVASSELQQVGMGMLQVDFAEAGIAQKAGRWTLHASGELHVAQPSLLWGHTISAAAVQLEKQAVAAPSGPHFVATGTLPLVFTGGAGPSTSPEGCDYDPSGVAASMTAGPPDELCRAGGVGYAINYGAGLPAEFLSEPLPAATVVGGDADLVVYLADAAQPAYGAAFGSGLSYALDAVDDSGKVLVAIGGGDVSAVVGSDPERGAHVLKIPATMVPAGARLRLHMLFSGVYASSMRMLWSGEYGDAGLTLTTGMLEGGAVAASAHAAVVDDAAFGGAMGGLAMVLGGVLCLVRRRVRSTA